MTSMQERADRIGASLTFVTARVRHEVAGPAAAAPIPRAGHVDH